MARRKFRWALVWAIALPACGSGMTDTKPSEPPAPGTAPPPPAQPQPSPAAAPAPGSFGDDLAFIQKHTEPVILQDATGKARIIVAPEYQGRVLTSTASGDAGASYGWINREVIAAGKRADHMTVFGGEDRFWLGPEGGQYAIYFKPGAKFDLENWQVPEAIDWGPWPVKSQSQTEITLTKDIQLENYSGTKFELSVERTVRLLSAEALAQHLGAAIPEGTQAVAYESINEITNTGKVAWTRKTGLLSVWILGMYNPSPTTTVIIPFKPGPESKLGPIVNDAYFGKVPEDRLKTEEAVLYFRGDGQMRGKIGIPKPRAHPNAGSYDSANGVLTLVQYTLPEAATDYVNSMWEIQKAPYDGDVVNSYNDGPPEPGKKPLGPFYELETSSPAAALAPGESLTHMHRTVHLQGTAEQLDPIARQTLSVGLADVTAAFAK